LPVGSRPHGIFDKLRYLIIPLSSKVGEPDIGAYGDHFNVLLPEFFILLCQSLELGGANDGKSYLEAK